MRISKSAQVIAIGTAPPPLEGRQREGKEAQGGRHREIGGVFVPRNGGCFMLQEEAGRGIGAGETLVTSLKQPNRKWWHSSLFSGR
jgi:hypothetical protein